MWCAPPFRPSRPSPRWTRLGRTLLGKGPKWSPKGTQLGGQAKGASQPLPNPSRTYIKGRWEGVRPNLWAALAATPQNPSRNTSCATPPGGLPSSTPPLSPLAWRSHARGRSPPSTPPQPSWCRDLSSHVLLACGIKERTSTSSRMCGYRGGAGRAVLDQIGSRG